MESKIGWDRIATAHIPTHLAYPDDRLTNYGAMADTLNATGRPKTSERITITDFGVKRANPSPLVVEEVDILLEEYLSPRKLVSNSQLALMSLSVNAYARLNLAPVESSYRYGRPDES